MTGFEKVNAFIGSLGVVATVAVAAFVAFYATCFAVCMGGLALSDLKKGESGNYLMVASVGSGLVVGFAVAVFLLRWLWSRKARS